MNSKVLILSAIFSVPFLRAANAELDLEMTGPEYLKILQTRPDLKNRLNRLANDAQINQTSAALQNILNV